MGFSNFFLCAAFFLILHIFKNIPSLGFKYPPPKKKKTSCYFILSAITSAARVLLDFVPSFVLPLLGKGLCWKD